MFKTLPKAFNEFGVSTDIRALLTLRKAIEKGLVRTVGDLYIVLKGIIVKDPKQMGPYTKAFYQYFLAIEIKHGETLNDAVLRSEAFKEWKATLSIEEELSKEELVSKFLDEVHLSSYDIKEVLNGRQLFDDDNPDLEDTGQEDVDEAAKRELNKLVDYSDLSLEELLERMKKVMEKQNSRHAGGNHWIGTGGTSPYGHGGAAKNGIRVGGSGGGKMARKVLNDRNFYPVDLNQIINDDSIDAALASLKGIIEESAHERLDVKNTIKKGLKRGGLFIPEIESISQEKLQVILLIDNGGYSMTPYVKTIRTLFKKMKTRFAHDLETYYFHNTIYNVVFSDPQRTKQVKLETLLSKDPNYKVFILGDAAMAPYEINDTTVRVYKDLTKKFKKIVWLNPEPERVWNYTMSTEVIKQLVPMFAMTPKGIEKAIMEMNKVR